MQRGLSCGNVCRRHSRRPVPVGFQQWTVHKKHTLHTVCHDVYQAHLTCVIRKTVEQQLQPAALPQRSSVEVSHSI